MERQFSACQTHRSKYPSIFNSFRVIRCLSPKNAIFTTFWFPLGSPWGNHAKCCMDGKRIRCLQIVSLHVPTITVSEIQRDIGRKSSIFFIPPCQTPRSMYPSMFIMQFPSYSNLKCKKIAVFTYRSPHFCFPWTRHCDYHAICSMDRKTIQCLPNPSLRVPIYLQ